MKFDSDAKSVLEEYGFENVVCTMAAMLFRLIYAYLYILYMYL